MRLALRVALRFCLPSVFNSTEDAMPLGYFFTALEKLVTREAAGA